MEKEKTCFRCKKGIEPKEDYYSFTEYHLEEIVKIDYAHKKCWDDFMKSLDGATTTYNKANYLLNALGKQMNTMGMLPDEEVVIR